MRFLALRFCFTHPRTYSIIRPTYQSETAADFTTLPGLFLSTGYCLKNNPLSPHLNQIEKMWVKAKQRWLRQGDYVDLAGLQSALNQIWAKLGSEYRITFS